MKKTKILFFTPHGGRTGSEMLLWNIFQNLNQDKYPALARIFPSENYPFKSSGRSLKTRK